MKGKKYIIGMLGLAVVNALVLTGCGNNKNTDQAEEGKKLVCTIDMSSSLDGLGNMSTSIEFDYDKDGKEIERVVLGIDTEITSEAVTEEMLEAIEQSLKENCDNEKDKVDSCDVTRNDAKIKFKAIAGPDKISDLSGVSKDQAIEDVKENMENEGYTCK